MPNLENENQEPEVPIEKTAPLVEKQIQTPTPFDSIQKKKKIALEGFDYLSADQGKIMPSRPGYMDLSPKEKLREQASAFTLGAVKTGRGVLGTIEAAGEGVEWLLNALPGIENVDLDWDLESESFKGMDSQEVTQALGDAIGIDLNVQTEAGEVTGTIVNWGLGMVLGGAAIKAGSATLGAVGAGSLVPARVAQVATKVGKTPVGKLAGWQGKEAIMEATFMETGEDNLSNLIQDTPLANPVNEYLAADPNDSEARAKFKLAVEGFITGGIAEVGMKGVAKGAKALGLAEVFTRGVDKVKASKLARKEGDDAIDILATGAGDAEIPTPEQAAKRARIEQDAWYRQRGENFRDVDLNLADERELGKSIQNVKEVETNFVKARSPEENKAALEDGFRRIVNSTKKPGGIGTDEIMTMSMEELKIAFPKEVALANNLLRRAVKEDGNKGFQAIAGNFLATSRLLDSGEDYVLESIYTQAITITSNLPNLRTKGELNKRIRGIIGKSQGENVSVSKTISEILSIKEVRDEVIKSPTYVAELLNTFSNADRMYDILLKDRGVITDLQEPLESLSRKPRRASTKATRALDLTAEAEENALQQLKTYIGEGANKLEANEVAEKAFLKLKGALADENLTGVDFITSLSAYNKPGMMDALTEYRYANMLSSPRGRILDAFSSSAQVLMDKFSETIGGLVPDRLLFGKGVNKGSDLWKNAENTYKEIKDLDEVISSLAEDIRTADTTLTTKEITTLEKQLLDARTRKGNLTKKLNDAFDKLSPQIHNEVAREVGFRTMLADRFKEVMSYYNPFGNMSTEDKQRAILSSIESFRSGSSITLAERGIEASSRVSHSSTSVSRLFKGKKTATQTLKGAQTLSDEDAIELVANTFGVRAAEMGTELVDAVLELNKTGLGVTAMIDNWNKTAVTNSHIRSTLRTVGRKMGKTGDELEKFVERKFKESYDGLVFKEERAVKDAQGRAIRYFDELGGSNPTSVVDETSDRVSAELEVFMSEEYALIPKTADEVTNTKRFDSEDGWFASIGTFIDSSRKGKMGKYMTHIIPFLRTPINLAISASRMSVDPAIGFIGKVAEKAVRSFDKDFSVPDELLGFRNQFIRDLNSGNPTLRARALGRFATGTTFIAGATALAYNYNSEGVGIVGPGPGSTDWKKHQAWVEAGNIPYSVKLPNGTSIEFKRLGPLGIVLGSVAAAAQVNEFSGEDADNTVARAILAAIKYQAEESNILVLEELTKWSQGADEKGLANIERTLLNIAAQYSPGGSITRDVMKFQSEGESVSVKHDWEFLEDSIEKMKQFYGLTESAGRLRRNFFGEPIKKSGWGETEVGNPRINPLLMVSSKKGDPVMRELVAMDYSFPSNPTKVNMRDATGKKVEVDLTAYFNKDGQEAYDRMNELMGTIKLGGRTFKERLKERMEDPKWESKSEKYKNAVVSEFRTAFKTLALREIQKEYGEQMGLVSPETQEFLK